MDIEFVLCYRNLTAVLGRCGEVIEFLLQSALSYTSDLLHSALLHDAQSHDWKCKKPYGEGCQSSLTLQMWAFYMQGEIIVYVYTYCMFNIYGRRCFVKKNIGQNEKEGRSERSIVEQEPGHARK